jgi:hypothetical protein
MFATAFNKKLQMNVHYTVMFKAPAALLFPAAIFAKGAEINSHQRADDDCASCAILTSRRRRILNLSKKCQNSRAVRNK